MLDRVDADWNGRRCCTPDRAGCDGSEEIRNDEDHKIDPQHSAARRKEAAQWGEAIKCNPKPRSGRLTS